MKYYMNIDTNEIVVIDDEDVKLIKQLNKNKNYKQWFIYQDK